MSLNRKRVYTRARLQVPLVQLCILTVYPANQSKEMFSKKSFFPFD
jgi:hypothetical protein